MFFVGIASKQYRKAVVYKALCLPVSQPHKMKLFEFLHVLDSFILARCQDLERMKQSPKLTTFKSLLVEFKLLNLSFTSVQLVRYNPC